MCVNHAHVYTTKSRKKQTFLKNVYNSPSWVGIENLQNQFSENKVVYLKI